MRPDGTNGYDIEYRTIGLEDGIERWCSAKGKASFENGVASRFIGTIRDISKLKSAELQQQLLTREPMCRWVRMRKSFTAALPKAGMAPWIFRRSSKHCND